MTAPAEIHDVPPGCEPGGQWLPLTDHGYSRYEVWSAGAQGRHQQPVRKASTGHLMAVSPGTNGYLRTKIRNDQGQQKTFEVHALILLANVGPLPPGQETRHLGDDKFDNRWAPGDETETFAAGGRLIYGTKKQNHADQVDAGTASPPPTAFECASLITCGQQVTFEAACCPACRTEAAALVSEGVPLGRVAARFGKGEQWAYAAACQYGGYKGTLAQARAQKQTLRHRVSRWFERGSSK